jgi:hypothetical protein
MLILKYLKTLQHVSIIIQIIFREFVGSLLKSLNLKFCQGCKSSNVVMRQLATRAGSCLITTFYILNKILNSVISMWIHGGFTDISFTFCWPCIMQWFLVNDQREAQIPIYVFIFIFNSLHVSSTSCSSSGETNCINTTSGDCHFALVAVSCASCHWQRQYDLHVSTLNQACNFS